MRLSPRKAKKYQCSVIKKSHLWLIDYMRGKGTLNKAKEEFFFNNIN